MTHQNSPKDVWSSGDSYESYVGRWSRLVAKEFLAWLNPPAGVQWLDVGCGTGALSQAILNICNPKSLKGLDRSDGYIEHVHQNIKDGRAEFEVGDAQSLPVDSDQYDFAVSGLVLNFVPQPGQMVAEMKRAVRPGATVALYVWDYAGEMQFMRHFWDAVVALNPETHYLDEGNRFPICQPNALSDLFQQADLNEVETRAIDIATDFKDFDDYWSPFLGGQGPAPTYISSLSEEKRIELKEKIRARLPFATDGSIPLMARAWAVKGTKP